jgi:Carboxypeptidase regulatory-like domain
MKTIWLVLLAVLLLCAPATFAQKKKAENTRSVQGTVTLADDSPADGAVVQLKNTKTLQVRSFITKEDGTYHFYDLSPDIDYELKADYQGASSNTKTLSSFDSQKQSTLNLKLNPKK